MLLLRNPEQDKGLSLGGKEQARTRTKMFFLDANDNMHY